MTILNLVRISSAKTLMMSNKKKRSVDDTSETSVAKRSRLSPSEAKLEGNEMTDEPDRQTRPIDKMIWYAPDDPTHLDRSILLGADPTAEPELFLALIERSEKARDVLQTFDIPWAKVLPIAIGTGNVNQLKCLLDSGAKLSFDQGIHCFQASKPDLTNSSVAADVLQRTDFDEVAPTRVMFTLLENHSILRALLECKADPNAVDEQTGLTPLSSLMHRKLPSKQRVKLIKILVESGADVNKTDQNGNPLGLLMQFNHEDADSLQCLLAQKADADASVRSLDKDGTLSHQQDAAIARLFESGAAQPFKHMDVNRDSEDLQKLALSHAMRTIAVWQFATHHYAGLKITDGFYRTASWKKYMSQRDFYCARTTELSLSSLRPLDGNEILLTDSKTDAKLRYLSVLMHVLTFLQRTPRNCSSFA